MTVIDKKPVPLYVKECSECGSKFTYRRVEVGFGNCLPCPVCGYGLWATFDEFKDEETEENRMSNRECDEIVCHCNVKENAELIAKIMDYDVESKVCTDVVEVKHGEWIQREHLIPLPWDSSPFDYKNYDEETHSEWEQYWHCSECDYEASRDWKPNWNYCPVCGADMRGKTNE